MRQKHLFVMYPLAKLNLKLDSSLRMACELMKLGHEIYWAEPRQLAWHSKEQSAHAPCQPLTFERGDPTQVVGGKVALHFLHEFQGIHMRKEPPFDWNYVATTWLLDSAASCAHIFNAPAALRALNEKLSIFLFPEAIQPALVSSEPQEMMAFIKEYCQGDGIIKPLDLFGGKGIFRLQLSAVKEAAAFAQLVEATAQGQHLRLVQAFDHEIFNGEVRVFALGGKPLAWCLKKPQSGNFFANTSAGAILLPYTPPKALESKITAIAGELAKKGVNLVGFDVIGGAISEINITSPRLLQAPGDSVNYYEKIAEWIAQKCLTKPDDGV